MILAEKNWFERRAAGRALGSAVWRLGSSLRRHRYDLGIDVRGDVLTVLVLALAGLAADLVAGSPRVASARARVRERALASYGWAAFAVGVLFKTPEAAIEEANRKASQVEGGEDRPMELR